MSEGKTYKPVIYANYELNVPELNWKTSISVDCFNLADTTPYKVFWQLEPEDIIPTEERLIKNHKFYDLILTYNSRVLSKCPNAVLFSNNGVWTKESDTSQKKFQVSFLTSAKTMCAGHRFRIATFKELQQWLGDGGELPLPVKMHMSPPYLQDKRDMLVPFQYAISIQNSQQPNYFSEILLDCFATKTIPIFWGCANIGQFFNLDGVLSFSDVSPSDTTATRLKGILGSLTPDFYHSSKVQAAVEENYRKALAYKDRIGLLVGAITTNRKLRCEWASELYKAVGTGIPDWWGSTGQDCHEPATMQWEADQPPALVGRGFCFDHFVIIRSAVTKGDWK